MLDVEWATGVGYGDFVTGLGYAHTSRLKYQVPVNIKFHWFHSKDYLFDATDPETIVDRCNYVESILKPLPGVTVTHEFDSKFPHRFINQLDEFNPLHGLWYSKLKNEETRDVVLWTSRHNKTFPGVSKDPAYKVWDKIIDRLELYNYNVKEVTYRTPVEEKIELIRTCAFGIGYDGLAHQLFKFMWKPVIVFCQRMWLNNILIPQGILEKNPERFLKRSLNQYLDEARAKVIKIKIDYKKYVNEKVNPYEHPLFNTPISR